MVDYVAIYYFEKGKILAEYVEDNEKRAFYRVRTENLLKLILKKTVKQGMDVAVTGIEKGFSTLDYKDSNICFWEVKGKKITFIVCSMKVDKEKVHEMISELFKEFSKLLLEKDEGDNYETAKSSFLYIVEKLVHQLRRNIWKRIMEEK